VQDSVEYQNAHTSQRSVIYSKINAWCARAFKSPSIEKIPFEHQHMCMSSAGLSASLMPVHLYWQNARHTLSNLSMAEQMARNFLDGTPAICWANSIINWQSVQEHKVQCPAVQRVSAWFEWQAGFYPSINQVRN